MSKQEVLELLRKYYELALRIDRRFEHALHFEAGMLDMMEDLFKAIDYTYDIEDLKEKLKALK